MMSPVASVLTSLLHRLADSAWRAALLAGLIAGVVELCSTAATICASFNLPCPLLITTI
jgi:hypothetical protein